ncbi:unnamed protein product [Rangifer tarandus platyrhynchus]|uniref:Uncharacterized protein n=2 Tax=Rangifer tarandus platyrhynchus TaxID=3082113 RepID=A0ABN8Z514_RANTA|nr:unnamed protein product [Rangifer tarandus platyrhynchus]
MKQFEFVAKSKSIYWELSRKALQEKLMQLASPFPYSFSLKPKCDGWSHSNHVVTVRPNPGNDKGDTRKSMIELLYQHWTACLQTSCVRTTNSPCPLFFLIFKILFIWLCQVLVAACSLLVVVPHFFRKPVLIRVSVIL